MPAKFASDTHRHECALMLATVTIAPDLIENVESEPPVEVSFEIYNSYLFELIYSLVRTVCY